MTGSMPQSGDRRIVRLSQNVLHLSIGQAISTALGFLLAVALGRALSPSDFGILYIVGTIYGFAGILIDWGQSTYVIRDTAQGRTDESEFIGATLILRILGNLVAGAAGIVAALVLGYDEATIQLIALVAVVGFPISLATLFGLWFRGKDRVDLDVLIGLVGKALGVAAIILAIGAGGGLFAIVGMSAVGSVGGFALGLLLFRGFRDSYQAPAGKTAWRTCSRRASDCARVAQHGHAIVCRHSAAIGARRASRGRMARRRANAARHLHRACKHNRRRLVS